MRAGVGWKRLNRLRERRLAEDKAGPPRCQRQREGETPGDHGLIAGAYLSRASVRSYEPAVNLTVESTVFLEPLK
jgi:hypothetical protein